MTIRPSGRLSQLPPSAWDRPLAVLGLRARSANCLANVPTVGALLERREDELMSLRSFGCGCLAEVRRAATLFVLAALGVGEHDPAHAACASDSAGIAGIWNAPPQRRALAEVVEEALELLHRAAELYPRGRSSRRAHTAEPADSPNLRRARLEEVVEFVFANLRPREREVLLARHRVCEAETVGDRSLAELGRELELTRERVRQLLVSAHRRLSEPVERRRRRAVRDLLGRAFETRDGVATLQVLRCTLAERFSVPEIQAAALTHALLHTDGGFHPVRDEIWCASPLNPGDVAAGLDSLHLALRRHGKPMSPRQLVASVGPAAVRRALSESAVRHWMAADGRFHEVPPSRLGLREWEHGVPESLEGCLAAILRTEGRALPAARLLERANLILPPEAPVTYREVLCTLHSAPRFERVRPATYALRRDAEREGGVVEPAPNGN